MSQPHTTKTLSSTSPSSSKQYQNIFGGRSWTWRILAHHINACEALPTNAQTPHRNGPHSTENSHSNQQQHGMRGHQQQHTASANKSNGHEISLLWNSMSISFLLAPCWQKKLRRLLDEASLRGAPHWKTSHHINPTEHRHSPASITPPQTSSTSCQSSMCTAKQQNKKLWKGVLDILCECLTTENVEFPCRAITSHYIVLFLAHSWHVAKHATTSNTLSNQVSHAYRNVKQWE